MEPLPSETTPLMARDAGARGQFGPLIQSDGAQFRLWAPAAKDVVLVFKEGPSLPMAPADDGWHFATAKSKPGTRYAFRVNGIRVPDPASREQSGGVHGWSVLGTAASYEWRSARWKGRPWHETVLYETHAGLEGGFTRLADRLPALKEIGFTAIELMPIAAFPGTRNWGYDGVLPFAPAESYGTPSELKALVDRAHALSLMVFLDVVYNHFGPDGNYLGRYAPNFFRHDLATPWGTAIDFRQKAVRRFFIENALYWINEFRIDGLRLDAVHTISDRSWLFELSNEVRSSVEPGRHVHLVLENDANDPALLEKAFDAQWSDDFHHVLHVALTREEFGYYRDHSDNIAERLARVLHDGFDYQGQFSPHRKHHRGGSSSGLPPTAFVSFLQNHDQTGNRAQGDRLTTLTDDDSLRAAIALLLLAPQIPMIFFGEEIGSRTPFLYFTDHPPDLAEAVRRGRAAEFPGLEGKSAPDPNSVETYLRSNPWSDAPDSSRWLDFYRDLLTVRREKIIPRLMVAKSKEATTIGPAAVLAKWTMSDGSVLTIATNLGPTVASGSLPHCQAIWGSSTSDQVAARSTVAWLE